MKYRKRIVGYFLIVLVFLILFLENSLAISFDTDASQNTVCFPGCFIYMTISMNETMPYVNISFNGANKVTPYISTNDSYAPFYNNSYNLTENDSYMFEMNVWNPQRLNTTVNINVNGYITQINITDDYNLEYYKQKIINSSSTLSDFDILENGVSILSSYENDKAVVDLQLTANINDYTSNQTDSATITISGVNESSFDFTKLLDIYDQNAQIYYQASLLNSVPRFIVGVTNLDNFISQSPIYHQETTINEKGNKLYVYYYLGGLNKLENIVGEDPFIIQTQNSISVITNTSVPIAINDYSFGPVVTYMNISSLQIHAGQIVTFTLFVNDSYTKYVSINDVPLTNVSRYIWTKNISITQSLASLYILDNYGNSLYLENITFDINNVPPILYLYSPTETTYLSSYVNVIWSSEDQELNSTYFYVDNGQYYYYYPGYQVDDNGKYFYNVSSSGTIQIGNLLAGLHKIDLFATDNYSNIRQRSTYFRVNTLLNNTRFTSDVLGFDYNDYLNYINTTYIYYDNNTNTTYNVSYNYTYQDYRKYKGISKIENWNITSIGDSVAVDKNMNINIELNETKYNTTQYYSYDLGFSFFGLDANWQNYFGIERLNNNLISNLKNKIDANVIDMFFFDNIDSFFLNKDLCMMNLTFPYPYLNYDVFYYDNETSIYPVELNSSQIIKNTNSFTINGKCVYGIIIIKKNTQMRISIDSISNPKNDNFFNITGTVYSFSNNISCSYKLNNFVTLNQFKQTGTLQLEDNIVHPLSINFAMIPNDFYKLNISCIDLNSKTTSNDIEYVYVVDTTPPQVISVRNVGPDTIPPYSFEDNTAWTLNYPTMTIFTDEPASCAYSENDIDYDNMTLFDETNDTKHTTKLPLLNPEYLLFIRCIDDNHNEMVGPKIIQYTIKNKYIPPPASVPSVGQGTVYNPIEASGDYERNWQRIDRDSTLNINFEVNSTSFESLKLTASTDLENISFAANISQTDYGYNITPLYASLNMKIYNFENNNLAYRTVDFHVSNNWISEKKIKPEDIVLAEKNNNGEIVYANTYKLRTSSDYTYYRAEPEYFDTYFITAIKEIDYTSGLYQNQNDNSGKSILNITNNDNTNESFGKQNITVKQRSYAVVTVLILILSLLIAIIFASRQINQTSKQEITKLYRSKRILSDLNKQIISKQEEKDNEKNENDENQQKKNENKNM